MQNWMSINWKENIIITLKYPAVIAKMMRLSPAINILFKCLLMDDIKFNLILLSTSQTALEKSIDYRWLKIWRRRRPLILSGIGKYVSLQEDHIWLKRALYLCYRFKVDTYTYMYVCVFSFQRKLLIDSGISR